MTKEFGRFLFQLRQAKELTLRQVEDATRKEVSNAYLSQIENGHIAKPAPSVLESLSNVYGVPYERLMEKAGYLKPSGTRGKDQKHGRAATSAIGHLTPEEEHAVMAYLEQYRKLTKGKS